ncbi:MAG: phage portal protein [Gemmataceae bacterium]
MDTLELIPRLVARTLTRLAGWLAPTSAVPLSSAPPWPGRARVPTAADLLAELKSTAWTCATLNAAVCASFPPRLYVRTRAGQPAARCATRALSVPDERRMRALPHLASRTRGADRIEEVVEHPLLSLLAQVNPVHNAFDLWELTTLYQEVHGAAYWLIEPGPLGTPDAIWPLPSHLVTPLRDEGSHSLVDAYLVRTSAEPLRVSPERIITFLYPDPRDPYRAGLSPLRACFDQVRLTSDLTAFRQARFANHAIPDALVCPDEMIGEEERDRLEQRWNDRLRRGGAGRVLVAESSMRVQLLQHSMGDLAALADQRATREEIANAFGVPLAFLTTQTNLANLQAAEQQHAAQTIRPRLRRRDEKLNERLIPWFDPTGRLFLASDDPVPGNRELTLRERDIYLRHGVLTINEVRSERGLPPVTWGDTPTR